MKEILLIGGGGHCRSVIDVIETEGKFKIAGIIDNNIELGTKIFEYNVIGKDKDLKNLRKKYKYALVTVGQIKSSATRTYLFNLLKELDYKLPYIISPLAYISKYATIDEGTVIMHHAIVNAGAKIGKNCIINTKALIEHDAITGNHCHISTGAIVNGETVIKEGSFIGSNSIIRECFDIKAKTIVWEGRSSLKIGYFADEQWGVNSLKKFLNDKTLIIDFIVLRYNSPDREILKIAKNCGIKVFIEKNINSISFLQKLKSFKTDLFVSMSFDQIFKKEILKIPSLGAINCHAGRLPFYRGRNVLNWVLINDEKYFGITVHYVDEGIDTGDIILQRCFEITDEDDYSTLLEKTHIECANILYEAIKLLQNYKVVPIKQREIHPIGFYCSSRKKGDEIINWNLNSREIFNFVRAICRPGPMAKTFLNGKEMKINKVKYIKEAPEYKGIPGTIIGIKKDGFYVKTKDSFIKVVEYEFDGKLKIGGRLLDANRNFKENFRFWGEA